MNMKNRKMKKQYSRWIKANTCEKIGNATKKKKSKRFDHQRICGKQDMKNKT